MGVTGLTEARAERDSESEPASDRKIIICPGVRGASDRGKADDCTE